jgi:Cys-rich protein (TIGR01571 family)
MLALPALAALVLFVWALSAYDLAVYGLYLLFGSFVHAAVITATVTVLRHKFRAALGVPGTPCGDCKMSNACVTLIVAPTIFIVVSTVLANMVVDYTGLALGYAFMASIAFSLPPCYAPPSLCPGEGGGADQCTPAFQLALMESALERRAALTLAQGAHSGMGKEAAPLLPAQLPPQRPAARQGAWSTGLLECTCTPHCEGDIPLVFCSVAWGWWMQARVLQRTGYTSQRDFVRVAGFLCCLQGLPAVWGGVAALVHATGVAVQVVYCIAALPALVAACWLRRHVRERYGIAGASACEDVLCEDFLKPTLCFPCSIAQLDRELTLRGEAGSSF